MIYFIILFGLLALSYRYDYCNRQTGKKFWMVAILVTVILVAGLRYRIGTDSIRYESYYKTMPELWELSRSYFMKVRFEPGFLILMSACRSISSDFTLFQIVHAVIVNVIVFRFFYKNTDHFFIGIFLYCLILFVQLNFEVLREALSVATFLLAWEFFKKKNFIIYYLLIWLAILFHVGAAICLICPIVMIPGVNYFFRLGKRTFIICAAILIVGFAVNIMFFKFIQMLSFSATLVDRATAYSKDELGGSVLNFMGALGVSIRWVFMPCLSLYVIEKARMVRANKNDYFYRCLQAMTLVSVYVGLLTIPIHIVTRFNDFFFFFSILSISIASYELLPINKKKIKLSFLYWLLIFSPLIVLQFKGQTGPVGFSGKYRVYMSYYPYASRLNPEENRNREALFRFYKSW